VSAFAVPSFSSKNIVLHKRERDWTGWGATIYVPTGKDDIGYQQSSDNGTTWKSNLKTSRLQSVQTVGYRVKGQPETAFIARNPGAFTHWLEYDYNDDYRLGLYNEDGDVYTDYSKSPVTPITPGEWIDIPLSADVSLNNDGHCDVDVPTPYTTTVYFKDSTITPLVFTGSGAIRQDPLQFHIDDLLAVKNITVDFANAAIYPGDQAPFQAKYVSATEAPLVTGHINIFGGFCDEDD
jgi:hypothetical protein